MVKPNYVPAAGRALWFAMPAYNKLYNTGVDVAPLFRQLTLTAMGVNM